MYKQAGTALLAAAALLLANGCSGNSKSAADVQADVKPPTNEPVTIKFRVNTSGYLSEDEYQKYIVEPVKKRLPHITLVKVTDPLDKLVPTGELPDISVESNNIMTPLIDFKLLYNIEPLAKQAGIDWSRFEEGSLTAIRTPSGGQLTAVPYRKNFSVNYYNKDIFDRLGVAYPKDGMSWEETIELGKKVTRTVDGVKTYGMFADATHRLASQLEIGFIDAKTLKPTMSTEPWKKLFAMMQQIYGIPGNEWKDAAASGQSKFIKDKVTAMHMSTNIFNAFENSGLNWDMVSYPTTKDNPGKAIRYDLHIMAILNTSKHKEAAMQVASVIVSDEVQEALAKSGNTSVLKNDKFQKVFGENLPLLKGKNIGAIFKTVPANIVVPTEFEAKARDYVNGTTTKAILEQGVDVNTALRQADEAIAQIIAAGKK
ncbi:MAG: family 1 extracellular solute-binding protein [Paenibacillus sp.]|nr:family 1 extracellular solute-binding protein [Paenibacillus sp.]